jgi:hypothetical protein
MFINLLFQYTIREANPCYNNSVLVRNLLIRHFDFNKALFEFYNLFNLEEKDERAIVIIGEFFLEMAFEHLLCSFFSEDDAEVKRLFEYNRWCSPTVGQFTGQFKRIPAD